MSSWTVTDGRVARDTWREIDDSVTGRKSFKIWRCTVCSKLGCTVDTAFPPTTCCCQAGSRA
jgi:hypothetical protein